MGAKSLSQVGGLVWYYITSIIAVSVWAYGLIMIPGSGLELVVGDVAQRETLKPEYFRNVVAVVACSAAIVKPKEGDTEDRAKYYQGIKVSGDRKGSSISES